MVNQMTIERREAYSQVLEILKRVEPILLKKIPTSIIEVFRKYKMNDYEFIYNDNVSLAEQNINDITRALLAYLNLNFWCENPQEKQELIEFYSRNDEILQIGFEAETIFKKTIPEEEPIITHEANIVEYKESFIKKIFKRIRSILGLDK